MTIMVNVDDTDTSISYIGKWSGNNTEVNAGTSGPLYQNTLHTLTGNGNFTYSFNGMLLIDFEPLSLYCRFQVRHSLFLGQANQKVLLGQI